MNEDLPALEQQYVAGWDINAELPISDYVQELPITLVLVENKLKVLDFLLKKKIKLNQHGAPAIVSAARNCKAATLELLVKAGAKIDAVDNVKKNAYSAALYSNRYDLLPSLHTLGLAVDADGGRSFRQAVSQRQRKAVEFFIAHGMNVNLHQPCMVYPYNPSAVAVATRNNDSAMVQFLVEHGADVCIKDKNGDRPYTHAVAAKNVEMQTYLQQLEPAAWHDVSLYLQALREYELPAGLLSLLQSEERRLAINGEEVSYIEFHPVLHVKEIQWKKRKLLDLLAEVDNYSADGVLVWSGKDQKLASLDLEHEEFRLLCRWEEFAVDPAYWINRLFE